MIRILPAPIVAPTIQRMETISEKAQPLKFSGTTNQQNVDEADLLKTDGDFIYAITNRVLSIVRSYPVNEAGVVSTITLEKTPKAIFILLAVFGTQQPHGLQ